MKENTNYSGVNESEQHVQWFWTVLEEFNQGTGEKMRMFLRFACGLDRLPLSPIEPLPMKIRNSDRGDSDDRRIRAEACMFIIKLPKYSSLEIMRERMLESTTASFMDDHAAD